MPALLTLLLAAHAISTGTPQNPLSVRQVMENAETFDGREVVLSGWLEDCLGLSCLFFASRAESRKHPPRYLLSIGSSAWFDAFARRHRPGPVVLRARFDARCVTDPRTDVIAVCTDRARSLDPVAIVR